MKGIDTLIKLSKRQLDELRREMVKVESQKEKLLEAIQRLNEELQRELKLAGEQVEWSGFFGGFAKRIQARQETLYTEIHRLDAIIEKMRDQIAEAFGELKRYELAKENAKQRAKEAQARKDTIMLDEIAGQQFRRKQTENN